MSCSYMLHGLDLFCRIEELIPETPEHMNTTDKPDIKNFKLVLLNR